MKVRFTRSIGKAVAAEIGQACMEGAEADLPAHKADALQAQGLCEILPGQEPIPEPEPEPEVKAGSAPEPKPSDEPTSKPAAQQPAKHHKRGR